MWGEFKKNLRGKKPGESGKGAQRPPCARPGTVKVKHEMTQGLWELELPDGKRSGGKSKNERWIGEGR